MKKDYLGSDMVKLLQSKNADAVIEVNHFDMTVENRDWLLLFVHKKDGETVEIASERTWKEFVKLTGKDPNDFLFFSKENVGVYIHYTLVPKLDRELG